MTVTGRQVKKGSLYKIQRGSVTSQFTFQFNPTERNMSRTPGYAVKPPPGSFEPYAYFGNIAGTVFSLKLLLDATEGYDAAKQGTRAQKAWLEQFTMPDPEDYLESIGSFVPPPEMLYSMGGRSWRVLMMNLSFRDVRFNTEGFETRTWAELDFQSVFQDLAIQRATLLWIQRMAKMVEVAL